jgi:hypothetical protein
MEERAIQGIKAVNPVADEVDDSVVCDSARWSLGSPVLHSKATRQLLIDAINTTNPTGLQESGENDRSATTPTLQFMGLANSRIDENGFSGNETIDSFRSYRKCANGTQC